MESGRYANRLALESSDHGGAAVRRPAPQPDADLAREIVLGLLEPDARASPKFLYDALGSRLFEAITELPEYYPTRTEAALLARASSTLPRALGTGLTLIDLGAGNCEKAERLFAQLQPSQYVAVDIASVQLHRALKRLRCEYPGIDMLGVDGDFSRGIALPDAVRAHKRLFLYLGSSIGNFSPNEALALLLEIRALCREDGALLIGVDLVKSSAELHAAYNDALGVTAAFNLNLLNHLNVLIGSDFSVGDWRHCAFFNAPLSRIEMHLEAKRRLRVCWPGGGRSFSKGERIHTENSYKYRPKRFGDLLANAGFGRVETLGNTQRSFGLYLARP